MQVLNLLAGAALLLLGRRLFWLFVAGVGFVAGAKLSADWLGGQPPQWVILLIALSVGLLGALISVVLQRIVVSIAGFFAGGYLLSALAVELNHPNYHWLTFAIGGIIGAVLVLGLLDWALIILSVLTGATVITLNLPLDPPVSALLFLVLLVIGMAAQAGQLWRTRHPSKRASQ